MARFGSLFSYTDYDSHSCYVAYYGVKLLNDWMGFPSGANIYRVEICNETGSVTFIDENESEIMKGSF